MEIEKYSEILQDENLYNFKKMQNKYGEDFGEFLRNYYSMNCIALPLKDFAGKNIYISKKPGRTSSAVKILAQPQEDGKYGLKAAEDEITYSNAIENINFSPESIKNILKGMAPKDETENIIFGQKKGLEFIADKGNIIDEENLYKLYMMTTGDFLPVENKLAPGHIYRHDAVYAITGLKYRHDAVYIAGGDGILHTGLNGKKLPEYMKDLIAFINADDDIDDLTRASVIHFYFSYLYPYFDGNGRMSRLVHLWFLIQKNYPSTLFVPFSSLIEKNRNDYYDSFRAIEDNAVVSGITDITPFTEYFEKNIYSAMNQTAYAEDVMGLYSELADKGDVTPKERDLWAYVLSAYGTGEFSTKQLEKDYGDAAYATIRTFVMKFEEYGLLKSRQMSNRVKYRVAK